MADLDLVFAELKAVLEPHVRGLRIETDTDTSFYVDTAHILGNKKPLFFGAVEKKKNHVSYHLMPVYLDPDLLAEISGALRKRMQGKSCFRFSDVDRTLFEELSDLTAAGVLSYREAGYL
jgi:hypothetical protein